MTEFKAYVDKKINSTPLFQFVFDRVENIVGKGENAGHQHFLLFLKCFLKAVSSGS